MVSQVLYESQVISCCSPCNVVKILDSLCFIQCADVFMENLLELLRSRLCSGFQVTFSVETCKNVNKCMWRVSIATARYSFRLLFKKKQKKRENKTRTPTPASRQNLTWPLSPFLVIINIRLFQWELFKGSRAWVFLPRSQMHGETDGLFDLYFMSVW